MSYNKPLPYHPQVIIGQKAIADGKLHRVMGFIKTPSGSVNSLQLKVEFELDLDGKVKAVWPETSTHSWCASAVTLIMPGTGTHYTTVRGPV